MPDNLQLIKCKLFSKASSHTSCIKWYYMSQACTRQLAIATALTICQKNCLDRAVKLCGFWTPAFPSTATVAVSHKQQCCLLDTLCLPHAIVFLKVANTV